MRLATLCLSVLCSTAFSLTTSLSAQTASDGWSALQRNDRDIARSAFQEALKSDPKDARAWFGLAFEANLRSDDSVSWWAYRNALQLVQDPAPYLYAAMSTSRFGTALAHPSWGAMDLLTHLTRNPDEQGILSAMSSERLAGIAESKENVKEAIAWYDRNGAIREWRIVGPFDNISGSGFEKVFPPEREDDTAAVYKEASGGEIRWQKPPAQRLDGWMDFTFFATTHRGQFYSVCYVNSPMQQRVQLRLGTSGSFKLFLNDSSVRETYDEHNNDLDTYITECTLNKGWNKLLVKVGASDLDRCNFLLRITDEHGVPLKDLQHSVLPEKYIASASSHRVIINPFIAFFNGEITSHPDRLENYLLLAESHLRNDEAEDAVAVLNKALIVAPNCLLIHVLLLDAYNRLERRDETASLLEHISAAAPDLPLTMNRNFNLAISQEKTEEADSILRIMKRNDSTSTAYFESAMLVAQRKMDLQLFNDLLERAHARYPSNFLYASLKASMSMQASQDPTTAIEVMKTYLKESVSTRGLETLAKYYTDAGDLESALATYNRLLALNPIGCGYYATIADVYIERKSWSEALSYINRALAVSPNISAYWYKRAVIEKSQGKNVEAIRDMEQALRIDPANFASREFIRDLNGNPHPFSFFPSIDVDSLIRAAPSASAYPNDDVVLLYDSKKRVVYDGSRCEVQVEYLARIFTIAGIDEFKEVSLPTNSSLNLEKAVVRKPSGREIQADRGSGQLVFKSIEPGDFIYVRYRFIEAESGRLGAYFSDSYAFNGKYPRMFSRYSILTPPGVGFNWRAFDISNEMIVTKNPYGELSTWETSNEPAIEYEDAMPNTRDIDKHVELTSIPNWEEIISWYYDIARTKTRSSPEVRALMDSLFPRSSSYNRDGIIAGVYRYITKDIRYSYVPFRQSGYVPQDAQKVINTRIGDCKDVATLCIAMLAERGISSDHVLVQTSTSAFQRPSLPSIPFDHVIVVIPGDSLPIFIDLTADNVPIGSIPYADVNAFSLVIRRGLREPMRLPQSYFRKNTLHIETDVAISEDNSAQITQTYVETGAGTQFYRSAWRGKTEKERDKDIIEMLSEDYPDVALTSVEIDDLDTLTPALRFSVTFTVPNYMMEAGGFLIARLPWDRPITPSSAFSYDKRIHPIDFPSFHDTTTEVIRMNIPSGYILSEEKSNTKIVLPQFTFERTSSLTSRQLEVTRKMISGRKWVLPPEYASFKPSYNLIVKEDRRSLLFMPKGTVVKLPKKKN
ncbi:MAG: tetratricopeptide repeat protein [Candidatus Kapabacteria bacterium]|nr:tetratricopeptide repeat protein [Candidatus Kapabacteria bacterium]